MSFDPKDPGTVDLEKTIAPGRLNRTKPDWHTFRAQAAATRRAVPPPPSIPLPFSNSEDVKL